ncbi:MAG: hypothetical protein QME94_18005, partial [Anaerolineae bacterium]|nr:hypothetical protein [Anaerolineae bacterium]
SSGGQMMTQDRVMQAGVRAWNLALFAFWLRGVLVYLVRCLLRGQFRSPKVAEKSGSWVVSRWIMDYGYWVIHLAGRPLVRWRVSPDSLTLCTLLLAVPASVSVYLGHFDVGGWLFIGAGILDILDGMVSRETAPCPGRFWTP